MRKNNVLDFNVYGNGTVIVADGRNVARFPDHDFDFKPSDDISRGDYWVSREVLVAFGRDVKIRRAIESLKCMIQLLEKRKKLNRANV
jgi:hypothetical protein